MIKLGEASDLILEVFGVNEYQCNDLEKLSFNYQNMSITIWNDEGLYSLLIGLKGQDKAYFTSIIGSMLNIRLLDCSYQLHGLKPSMEEIKNKTPLLLSILKDPKLEKNYFDKSGFKSIKV